MTDLVVALGASIIAFFSAFGIRWAKHRIDRRPVLARLGQATPLDASAKERQPLLAGLADRFEKTSSGRRLKDRAEERLPSALFSDYLALMAIGTIGGAVAGSFLFAGGPPVVLSALAGPFLAENLASRIAARRSIKLEQELPEALALQAAALRAGRSTLGSLRSMAAELSGRLKDEIEQAVREIDLGGPLEGALEDLVKRSRSRDIEMWVTAMLVHRQTGGNLATVVDSLSGRVRERAHMRAELLALTAQGRLSGIVIAIAPVAFFVLLSVTAREQMRFLYSTSLGLTLLIIGLAMEGLGFLWISRILKVKS